MVEGLPGRRYWLQGHLSHLAFVDKSEGRKLLGLYTMSLVLVSVQLCRRWMGRLTPRGQEDTIGVYCLGNS